VITYNKWRDQLAQKGDHTFTGQGRPTNEKQSELTSLKQENTRLKEEIEILKTPQRTLRGNSSEVRAHTITKPRA